MSTTPWIPNVRLYDAETTYDVDPQNIPIKDLTQRTQSLYERLNAFADKNAIIIESANVANDTDAGLIVYWDTVDGCYKPGTAVWSDTYGPNGELVVAEEGIAQGIVLNAPNGGASDVLLEGSYVLTDTQMLNLFGVASPNPGMYYLSAVEPGKAVNIKPATPVPVVYYRGLNRITMMVGAPPEHNHIHKNHILTAGWLPANETNFPDMEIPVAAQYGYDKTSDSYVDELFMSYPGDFTMTINGIVSNEFVSNKDNVWFTNSGDPSALGDLNMFTAVPYNYGQPIVRAIQTDQPEELSITGLNGVITFNNQPWTEDTPALNAYAIASIEGRTQTKTPVVSAIYPQKYSGIRVYKNDTTGEHVLDSDAGGLGDRYVEVVNMNNSMQVTDDAFVLLTFPEGRDSSMTGVIPCPQVNQMSASGSIMTYAEGPTGYVTVTSVAHGRSDGDEVVIQDSVNYNGTYTIANVTDNTFDVITTWVSDDAVGTWYFVLGFHYELTVFAERAGLIGATSGSPIDFPAITVDLTYTPQAEEGVPVDTTASYALSTIIPAESTEQGYKYFTLASVPMSVNEPGTAYITISMSSSNIPSGKNLSLYNFGMRIELIAD